MDLCKLGHKKGFFLWPRPSEVQWRNGNIDAAPRFVEPGYWADINDPNIVLEPNDPNAIWVEGNYHLLPASLCIDAGGPNYIAGPNETDLDGRPCIIGDNINTGAYETNYIEASLWIFPRVINRYSRMKKIMAWVHLPEGVTKAQIDSNKVLVLYPDDAQNGIESIQQFVIQRGRLGNRRTSIIAFFDKSELMGAIPDNGKVELEVVGNLTSGQYFYGTDNVWIKN